jgi:hypothetical protein
MRDFVVPNNDVDTTEEYVFEILYDSALDDGSIILDTPTCLEIAMCEGKYDMLVISDDTLIH